MSLVMTSTIVRAKVGWNLKRDPSTAIVVRGRSIRLRIQATPGVFIIGLVDFDY